MPRKSTAELSIASPAATGVRPRLTPPSSLSSDERLEFLAIADENLHLRRTDAVMLAAYVTAATKVMKLARSKDASSWERSVKTMLALARSLRLTQQSCTDPKTLTRARNKPDFAAIVAEMNGDYAALDRLNAGEFDDDNGYNEYRAQQGGEDDANA